MISRRLKFLYWFSGVSRSHRAYPLDGNREPSMPLSRLLAELHLHAAEV